MHDQLNDLRKMAVAVNTLRRKYDILLGPLFTDASPSNDQFNEKEFLEENIEGPLNEFLLINQGLNFGKLTSFRTGLVYSN